MAASRETQITKKQKFFRDLFNFEGPPPGHALRVEPPTVGDIKLIHSDDIEARAQMGKSMLEYDIKCREEIGDDRVPTLRPWSGTEIFAAAYGCPVHVAPDGIPFALPLVETAGEADKLKKPDMSAKSLSDIFKICDRMVELCGEDYPVRVCDLQSPFDIASLIWKKENFFVALVDTPDAVHTLLRKTTATLIEFLETFKSRYKNVCLDSFYLMWLPPELGIKVSEDEVGSLSVEMYSEFCYPYLEQLSKKFGGISLHCCARAEHQWDGFLELPGLRFLNFVHPTVSLEKAVRKFSGRAVLAPTGTNGHKDLQDYVRECLKYFTPDTRFVFIINAESLESAKGLHNELRKIIEK